MKRLLLLPFAFIAALLAAPASASAVPTSGYNDWTCVPSAEHPEPVVLVHGLGANGAVNWFSFGPALAKRGYCTYSLTYGAGALGPSVGGLAPMADSAAELSAFVEQVRSATGAEQVDLVGHSEGTTVSAYYLKFLGGSGKVNHYAGIAPNYKGTSVSGLLTLGSALGLADFLGNCAACDEFVPGSEFLEKLGEGGVAVPGPTYLNIATRYDKVVTPYTSGLIPGENVTNVVIQDVCRLDLTGHLSIAADPNALALVVNALDPAHATKVRCALYPEAV